MHSKERTRLGVMRKLLGKRNAKSMKNGENFMGIIVELEGYLFRALSQTMRITSLMPLSSAGSPSASSVATTKSLNLP